MTFIRANCPSCGDVELTVRQIVARRCVDDGRSSYAFCCPDCGMAIARDVEGQVVDVLVSSGVALVEWRLPAELFERAVGPPLNHDDLLRFHELLRDEGWFETLERTVAGWTPFSPPAPPGGSPG